MNTSIKPVNGNASTLTLVLQLFNAFGIVALTAGAFWAGGELRAIRDYQQRSVTCSTFASWTAKTERINVAQDWRGADIYDVKKQVEQHK